MKVAFTYFLVCLLGSLGARSSAQIVPSRIENGELRALRGMIESTLQTSNWTHIEHALALTRLFPDFEMANLVFRLGIRVPDRLHFNILKALRTNPFSVQISVSAAKSKNDAQAILSAEYLAYSQTTLDSDSIRDMLKHRTPKVRERGIICMLGSRDMDRKTILVKMLGDKSPLVRSAAILSYMEFDDIGVIVPLLHDASPEVLRCALRYLESKPSVKITVKVYERITELSNHTSPLVRERSIWCLHRTNAVNAMDRALDLSHDKSEVVRMAALNVLNEMRLRKKGQATQSSWRK